jgi:hypothetical protein
MSRIQPQFVECGVTEICSLDANCRFDELFIEPRMSCDVSNRDAIINALDVE